MKNTHLSGIDVLRGFGIFILIIMHTAFYHYRDLVTLDLNNPPLIVTMIGLLLMFAGIFAMISGFSYALQNVYKQQALGYGFKQILRYNLVAGGLILLVAYLYFLFTGPGLLNMLDRSMNNSLLVEFINSGKLVLPNLERILYIDSLIMIGTNIILLGFIFVLMQRWFKDKQTLYTLILTLVFFAISVIRIPLYSIYMNALNEGNYGLVLLLNAFVNKNNPIFPFLAFGLMGQTLALILINKGFKALRNIILIEGSLLFIIGVVLYITLPDTMLERSIDLIWYAIMMAQLGLFQLIVLGFITYYDAKPRKLGFLSRIFSRFSRGGLSVFFIESVISALIHRVLVYFMPDFYFGLWSSLGFGLSLALLWSLLLILWQRIGYRYGIEYWITRILQQFGHSQKAEKLSGQLV